VIYLLDTDIVIFLIRSLKRGTAAKAQRLLKKMQSQSAISGASLGISALTKAELEYGTARSESPEKERAALEKILTPFDEYAFDADECARFYGTIRRSLEQKGQVIGAMDLLIAAHALALGATLVSNNTRHFRRIRGLAVENWTV
tara:strand:+ start:674 stop:1108 length:435 start_codon:yes stop_codon:yes gene_type:complete